MKKTIITLVCLAFLAPISGQQYYNTVSSRCRHFLNLSIGGGVAENMAKAELVNTKIGANGNFAFTYEIDKKAFFFQIGVGVDYIMARRGLDPFTDSYTGRFDRDGFLLNRYSYVFTDYAEQSHYLMGSVPVMFGFNLTQYMYISFGAKLMLPFMSTYKTDARLYTEGVYDQFIDVISRNVPNYGFYDEADYQYKAPMTFALSDIYVAPTLELGARIPIAKKIDVRLGVYAEYALPVVSSKAKMDLIDYSMVELNPRLQNQENLAENIRFNPIAYSRFSETVEGEKRAAPLQNDPSQYLNVGIRATFRFDVTIPPKICLMCSDEFIPRAKKGRNPSPDNK